MPFRNLPVAVLAFCALVLFRPPARAEQNDLEVEAARALRKAVEFYRTRVSTHGGYHFRYTADLGYGRSEASETPHRVELQRAGTPVVGMAYLEAFEATGDRYYLEAARDVAHALVQGQLCSGGWDYFIDYRPEERSRIGYRVDTGCMPPSSGKGVGFTTLDDNVTQANLRLLMRVDRELDFRDARIHEAARFALDSLVKAQYPNGAWPQRYQRFPDANEFPVRQASYPESWPRTWPGESYVAHYTFNDNSLVDMIDTFLEAARIYRQARYQAAAEKGGDFILLAQMPEPQPGWAQQYDRDMHPAWARRFEPPGITGGESQGVMRMLLLLYRETGNRKYLEPIPRALAYYKRSFLPPVENPSESRRRACPGDTPCVARFYELRSNRPLYITKGTRVTGPDGVTTLVGGYEVSYSDESVIHHYGVLTSGAGFLKIEKAYREIESADPAQLRRPARLRGLSPWSDDAIPVGAGDDNAAPAVVTEQQVRKIIAGLDSRGAWLEAGVIGKPDRLVHVLGGKDMVLKIGDRTYPVRENETVELFSGPEPLQEQIIVSTTFARNVGLLSAFLAREGRKP